VRSLVADVRLLKRYVLVSLAPVLVLGLAVELTIRRQTEQTAVAAAADQAVLMARGVFEPLVSLDGERLPVLTEQSRADLVGAAERLAAGGGVAQLRIWSTAGQLLLDASDPEPSTNQVELSAGLFAAADDRVSVHRDRPPASVSPLFSADSKRFVTVFAPVHGAGTAEVVAVSELSVPWDQPGFRDSRARLRLALAASLALLWVVLAGLTALITSRLRRSELAHRHLALVDQLTGLPNRKSFTDLATSTLATLGEHRQPAAVVLLDLLRFAEVNKAMGRAHGDELLRHIAQRLQAMVQPGQVLARLGGDVFALLLPGVDGDGALTLLPVVREVLATEIEVVGVPISFEAAIGVASFPVHGEDIATLLQRADIAMQTSKRTHVDSLLFSPDLDLADRSRLGLAVELRRAIARDELELLYQPKVHLQDRSVHSVEALVRWNHAERGPIPPSEFVALAEESALIAPLTAWVLDHAVAQAARWAAEGLHLRIAVNVSAKNVRDERFPEQVIRTLARHDVPAPYIELELTETAIIADPERVARTVRRLRSAGVAVALDDFGQGSTSLAHLRDLPLSTLKIDKCFVDDLVSDPMDAAIVYTMIGLGHQLGLEVVAEGVETAEQFDTLTAWGCDVAQGYYFERPLTPQRIMERFGTPWYLMPEPSSGERGGAVSG